MLFLPCSANLYFMFVYRETGPYKFHEIKESSYLPDIVTVVMTVITLIMLDFLERVTGISLFCYLVLNCYHQQFPSKQKFWVLFKYSSFNLHFSIALFVFLPVGLFGLNKFGFICHQRNWVIVRKRQFTQFAGN